MIPNRKLTALAKLLKQWGHELGFQHIGIADINLGEHESHLRDWLANGYHGEMAYMSRHGSKRSRPAKLVPGTLRVVSVAMHYFPPLGSPPLQVLAAPELAYISRYALGRDYHKVMRKRLQKLARRIQTVAGTYGYRVFVDSAPVLEKALAENAGLGWIGKHTNLLNQHAGSWFFLGEIYTNLPLTVDEPVNPHCGNCHACLDVCPTKAIIAPYRLDARRCISYLTIELHGVIPLEFRPLIGNRIYGCDDCQLVCPWNRFAKTTTLEDFRIRHGLDAPELTTLFLWNEEEFLNKTEGTAIRRIGYTRWLRNIAIALGNAPTSEPLLAALRLREHDASPLVREHVNWAIHQHLAK